MEETIIRDLKVHILKSNQIESADISEDDFVYVTDEDYLESLKGKQNYIIVESEVELELLDKYDGLRVYIKSSGGINVGQTISKIVFDTSKTFDELYALLPEAIGFVEMTFLSNLTANEIVNLETEPKGWVLAGYKGIDPETSEQVAVIAYNSFDTNTTIPIYDGLNWVNSEIILPTASELNYINKSVIDGANITANEGGPSKTVVYINGAWVDELSLKANTNLSNVADADFLAKAEAAGVGGGGDTATELLERIHTGTFLNAAAGWNTFSMPAIFEVDEFLPHVQAFAISPDSTSRNIDVVLKNTTVNGFTYQLVTKTVPTMNTVSEPIAVKYVATKQSEAKYIRYICSLIGMNAAEFATLSSMFNHEQAANAIATNSKALEMLMDANLSKYITVGNAMWHALLNNMTAVNSTAKYWNVMDSLAKNQDFLADMTRNPAARENFMKSKAWLNMMSKHNLTATGNKFRQISYNQLSPSTGVPYVMTAPAGNIIVTREIQLSTNNSFAPCSITVTTLDGEILFERPTGNLYYDYPEILPINPVGFGFKVFFNGSGAVCTMTRSIHEPI